MRYYTWARRRAETTYKINKAIFEAIQHPPAVDLAIPYVYSFRSAHSRSDSEKMSQTIDNIEIAKIRNSEPAPPLDVLEQLSSDIIANGLLQPIVIRSHSHDNGYEILAGHLRFEACKMLGWKYIPAVVYAGNTASSDVLHVNGSK